MGNKFCLINKWKWPVQCAQPISTSAETTASANRFPSLLLSLIPYAQRCLGTTRRDGDAEGNDRDGDRAKTSESEEKRRLSLKCLPFFPPSRPILFYGDNELLSM